MHVGEKWMKKKMGIDKKILDWKIGLKRFSHKFNRGDKIQNWKIGEKCSKSMKNCS